MKNNVLLVGTGRHGKHYLQRFRGEYGIDVSKRIDNIYIADINKEHLETAGEGHNLPLGNRFNSLDAVIDKAPQVDAAFVAVSATQNNSVGKQLIEQGIPTLIEKPVSSSEEDLEEILSLEKESGVKCAGGYQTLFNPAFEDTLSFISNKDLEIKTMNVRWIKNRGFRTHFIENIIMEDTHPFVSISSLLGRPKYVQANFSNTMPIAIEEKEWEIAKKTSETDLKELCRKELESGTYVITEIVGGLMCNLEYQESNVTLQLDYEAGHNHRDFHISAFQKNIPDVESEEWYKRYDCFHDITCSLKPQPRLSIYGGIQGQILEGRDSATRRGEGKPQLIKSYNSSDELGKEISIFLDYLRDKKSNQVPPPLCSLEEAGVGERIARVANKSRIKGKKIPFQKL